MTWAGTCSIGTISSLLGSLSQPATPIINKIAIHLVFTSVVSRNGFAPGPRGEGPERLIGQRGLEEPDMPVGEQEVHAAGVAAIELIDFAARVSRPETPPGVPEHHAGGTFGPGIADAVIVHGEEDRPGDGPGPRGLAKGL